jgi:hypothetical protein
VSGEKGAERFVRENVTGIAQTLHSVARSSIEPMEGVLGFDRRRANPTAWRAGSSVRREASPPGESRVAHAANAGDGALAVAPSGDKKGVRGLAVRCGSLSRRAQGVSSQRDGTGRIPREARHPPHVLRRTSEAEAATAKNRGIRTRESAARTARPAIRKPAARGDASR